MDFPAFPSSPASDEFLVDQGEVFELGRNLIEEHLRALSANGGMPFDIKSFQVSHSAEYTVIVRANVDWTFEGQIVKSLEMLRIDTEGKHSGSGEVFG